MLCIFVVEGMYVVINVILSLMRMMSPPLPRATWWESMYFGRFCFRSELGFQNCDDICMCVVNKQFELLLSIHQRHYQYISLPSEVRNVCRRPMKHIGICNNHQNTTLRSNQHPVKLGTRLVCKDKSNTTFYKTLYLIIQIKTH